MATINAFHAIMRKRIVGLEHSENDQPVLNSTDIQRALEEEILPGKASEHVPTHKEFLDFILENGYSVEPRPAIYLYEVESDTGKQLGIWSLTNVQDFINGNILTHEHTLFEKEDRIRSYRKKVGIEGAPVLLTYRPDKNITFLIQIIVATFAPFNFQFEDQSYTLWIVDDSILIQHLVDAFAKIKTVYLADGHHRITAASKLGGEQWISTLYVSSKDLKIREFHRIIIPDQTVSIQSFMEQINTYFFISATPSNKPYFPDRPGRLGLCMNKNWYQLDLQENSCFSNKLDVSILQDHILSSFFGITDPKTDKRLLTIGPDARSELISHTISDKNAIAFTMYPITAEQLLDQAEKKEILPPKSTWIEPKIPFGIIMYNTKYPVNQEKGEYEGA